MKERLFYIVKYVRWIYSIYYYLGTFFVNFLKIFIHQDNQLILFISFGGKKFDDSPRAIYNDMISDPRFKDFHFIWAFNHPDEIEIPCGEKIKTDSLKYYIKALKARVWVTNSSVERGLSFKGKKSLYFDTWHGSPIKKMGTDINASSKSFRDKGSWDVDIFCAQSKFEADIFSRAFQLKRENIHIIGLPRNDIYVHYTQDKQASLRESLNIPQNKKVILYAPTYRENEMENHDDHLGIPIDFCYWEKELGNDYVVLFRAHYEVARKMQVKDSPFLRDVSFYPQLEDLMIISDILISDYSSIFFDYSIMHRPMLCFAYDYDSYEKIRGMYFDIRQYLPHADNEKNLVELIKTTSINTPSKETIAFQEKFVTAYGNATKESLNMIYSALQK